MTSEGTIGFNYYDYQGSTAFGFIDADNMKMGFENALKKRGISDFERHLFSLKSFFHNAHLNRYFVYSAVETGKQPEQWISDLRSSPYFIFRDALLKNNGKKKKQEGVDVRLAVEAMQFAFKGKMSHCTIFSGDGDLLPLVNALVNEGIFTTVVSFGDPNIGDVSPRLRDAADLYIHVGSNILRDCGETSIHPINSGVGQIDQLTQAREKHEIQREEQTFQCFVDEKGKTLLTHLISPQGECAFKEFRSLEQASAFLKLDRKLIAQAPSISFAPTVD